MMKVDEIFTPNQIINRLEDVATVAATIDLNGQYGNQIIDEKFRYLRVWKLFGNSWKLIAGSGFSI